MVSTPLDSGVVKMLQIWRPIKKLKATTTGVKSPFALYEGLVKMR